jgi:hypothetical protein
MELFLLEVNLCQNFRLIVLAATFSYEICFANSLAHWIVLSKLFYLICRDKVYLGTHILVGFDWLKTSNSP